MFTPTLSFLLSGATLLSTVASSPIVDGQQRDTSAGPSSTPSKPAACLLVDPLLCPSSGYAVEYYANPDGNFSRPDLTGPDSNYYVGQPALNKSSTNLTFFPVNNNIGPGKTRVTNGGLVVDVNNFTLAYTGYFRPPVSGTWQICGSADNQNDVYLGNGNAFNCLTGTIDKASTPLASARGANNNNPTSCFSADLTNGYYYPIRSVYGNAGGPSAYNLSFVPPAGSALQGSNSWTGYAYPPNCRLLSPIIP